MSDVDSDEVISLDGDDHLTSDPYDQLLARLGEDDQGVNVSESSLHVQEAAGQEQEGNLDGKGIAASSCSQKLEEGFFAAVKILEGTWVPAKTGHWKGYAHAPECHVFVFDASGNWHGQVGSHAKKPSFKGSITTAKDRVFKGESQAGLGCVSPFTLYLEGSDILRMEFADDTRLCYVTRKGAESMTPAPNETNASKNASGKIGAHTQEGVCHKLEEGFSAAVSILEGTWMPTWTGQWRGYKHPPEYHVFVFNASGDWVVHVGVPSKNPSFRGTISTVEGNRFKGEFQPGSGDGMLPFAFCLEDDVLRMVFADDAGVYYVSRRRAESKTVATKETGASTAEVERNLTGVTSAPEGALTLAEHCEYRVMQASLFKKPGTNPASDKIVRLKGVVGRTVHTTGRYWTGPSGGKWVELDSLVEKPGWLLIEGPGFGVTGPMLQEIEPNEEPPLVLSVVKPNDFDGVRQWREFVVSPNAKISEAKIWIALLFGLSPTKLILSKPFDMKAFRSGFAQTTSLDDGMGIGTYYLKPDDVLSDNNVTIREAGFQDGGEVQYVYCGDVNEGGEGKEPTWMASLKNSDRPALDSRPRRLTTEHLLKQHPELRSHFQVLDLPGTTPPDEIKRQYRRLALECHPDKHPEDVESATKRFQAVKAAYEVIRDKLRL